NKELNRVTNERGGGGGSGSPRATATAVQARLRAESALAEAQARESDLMFEVDKLRTEKRRLETQAKQAAAAAAKYGGDAEGLLKLGEEVKRLQELLSEEIAGRAEERRAARTKLEWYAENQDLLDGNLNRMQEQEEELHRLRQEVARVGKGA
ncbi:unnamed protein product, partial [Scytosiphon promiscuus]